MPWGLQSAMKQEWAAYEMIAPIFLWWNEDGRMNQILGTDNDRWRRESMNIQQEATGTRKKADSKSFETQPAIEIVTKGGKLFGELDILLKQVEGIIISGRMNQERRYPLVVRIS